ncbi:uncharacterized protein A1O9_06159 [Exophiala aquamarina CBS 119918]|uniref:Uncharacterized protein n=1 Tax=Exophiala aquamarina CBS 119918 TaxID=1182545 RepID=A0A072PG34_9EURO|nr:uncharacterized protein A1O9_06159 [Exophiala aquamarina CBS 119918]KEF58233.1 hypothetical protein A1O9_06159 [Exophiala aquamarina CBS 119918]
MEATKSFGQIISNAGVAAHVQQADGYRNLGVKNAPERFTCTPNFRYKDGVRVTVTLAHSIFKSHQYPHGNANDFDFVFSQYFGLLLKEWRLKPHPHEVVPGGLKGIKAAQGKLMKGKASAVKYVVRVEETDRLLTSEIPFPVTIGTCNMNEVDYGVLIKKVCAHVGNEKSSPTVDLCPLLHCPD